MQESFLTVGEVAELLKLNQQTVRNWIDPGELPAVRVGQRRVRIRQSDLDRFIAAGTTAQVNANELNSASEVCGREHAWDLFRDAMAESSAALASEHHDELAKALVTLADAAAVLAKVLRERPAS